VSDAFLGRGWSFPPTFDRSLGGVEMLEDEADVKSSLGILLSTMRGERVMLPLYGCNVESQIFEPLDTRQKTLLKDLIETAILYHEPRVAIEEVELRDDQALEGVVLIELTYRVKSTNSRFNVVYPFYLNEGTDVNLTASVTLLGESS
jgi:phage baseplate assembly protein W